MNTEKRLIEIEKRNKKVETDKAWETSYTRRVFISLITYACGCIVFKYIVEEPHWYIGAIVPVMGYALSTLGLPWARKLWEKITIT